MNRNAESHFAQNPTAIDISRSVMDRSTQHKTTMNVGDLIPILVDEVLPGDTFNLETSIAIRMQSLITPPMDNLNLETYFFFVPTRIVWEHFKEFMGENTTSKWEQETEYEIPQITAPTGGWETGTIMDYMGIPTYVENLSVNALPVRAYVMICNEWFRDQNLEDPAYLSKGDEVTQGSNGNTYQTDLQKGGKVFKVAKYHDYFTSALPEPQKGPDVLIPLGETAPVIPIAGLQNNVTAGLRWKNLNGTPLTDTNGRGIYLNPLSATNEYATLKTKFLDGSQLETNSFISPDNLAADLTKAKAANVNELRIAFQIQKLFEADARGGTRYREIIKSHFGTISPDARQQVPEYLGGERIPINIMQVLQTSETTSSSPQGNTAAFSLTNNKHKSFTKSFTEHGYIIGLACVRTEHTYQQGIERMWNRKRRFDFYWPKLANIGEQAILNEEIYAQGKATDKQAFGYQEAWAEYRYKPSRVSGEMRSNSKDAEGNGNSLDSWHFADKYDSQPYLGAEWIKETPNNVDRTLAIQSSVANQLFGDFYFKMICSRPMPIYSIPGLIDHH